MKGQITKQKIMNKILEIFPNSFLNDKEIRICDIEDGAEVQIKVTLTAAKENIEAPGVVKEDKEEVLNFESTAPAQQTITTTLDEKEKENLKNLMSSIGM